MHRYWFAALTAFILVLETGGAWAQAKSPQDSKTNAPVPTQTAASPGNNPDGEDDADIPAMARGRISEREYLRLRDQQTGMKRGVADLARHPKARSRAVRTLDAQQQASGGTNPPLGSLTWTPLGPDPIPHGQTFGTSVAVSGRVTALAIDPTDATGNTLYVGTAQGGVYRTLDAGNTWTPLMDSAQSLAIGALTLDPTDHTVLFVGTGEGNLSLDSFFGVGLYIITNANSTIPISSPGGPALNGPFNAPTTFPNPNSDGFTDVFTGRSVTKILVNPGNHNQILVSTSSGESGASGDPLPTRPPRGVYLSVNVFTTASTVGTPTFSRLTIQSASPNRLISDMVMDPANNNLVLVHVGLGKAVAGDGGVWASPTTVWTGTGTWTQPELDSADNGKFAANHVGTTTTFLLALDQTPSTGTCTKSGTLSQSTNGGSNWTELTAARGFCGGQCFYDMPVAIDPTTASNIYIGGQSGSAVGSCGSGAFGISTNAGASFSPSEGSLHADSHAIAIHPGNPMIIYTGNDGGVFRSGDGGTTWTTLNTAGFSATQFESIAVHPTDPNFTIGGTQDNGTPFLNPDGVTWTLSDGGDGGFSAIDQNATTTTNVTVYHTYFNETGTQIGFATANASNFIWSFFGCGGTANGINCSDTVLFYAPLSLGPGNPNTVYFGTDRLYRSSDRGATMTVVSQAPLVANSPISAIGISPQTDNVRIVGMGNDATTAVPSGKVFATTTGSSILTDVTGPWSAKYIARAVIDPNNATTAYVTLDGYGATTGHVWKTTNLSAAAPSWTSASSGLPDVPVNAFAVDPLNSNNLYAGTDIGVYNTTDGGNTWNPYGVGLPRVAVFDLAVTAKRTVRIATHGRGMWEIAAVSAGIATTLGTSMTPNPPGNGEILTVTVNHTSGTAVPTGTVGFLDSGTTLGSSQLNASGTATLATGNLTPGTHTFSAAYGGDNSYAASEVQFPAVVIAQPPDFSLSIPNSSVTVHAGQPATYSIAVQPQAGFTGTVSFSCTSGLPALTSCAFSPSTVTSSGSTTLTISTTAPTAAPPAPASSASLGVTGLFLGLVLFGAATAVKRPRRFRPAFLLLAVLALTIGFVSCGGSAPPVVHAPGTPTGTSTVTITATSGNTVHTATITLAVQ